MLELGPNRKTAYYKLKLYVDKERYVVLYQYMYAKSGKLLKTIKAGNVLAGPLLVSRYSFKDELKDGERNTMWTRLLSTSRFRLPPSPRPCSKSESRVSKYRDWRRSGRIDGRQRFNRDLSDPGSGSAAWQKAVAKRLRTVQFHP